MQVLLLYHQKKNEEVIKPDFFYTPSNNNNNDNQSIYQHFANIKQQQPEVNSSQNGVGLEKWFGNIFNNNTISHMDDSNLHQHQQQQQQQQHHHIHHQPRMFSLEEVERISW